MEWNPFVLRIANPQLFASGFQIPMNGGCRATDPDEQIVGMNRHTTIADCKSADLCIGISNPDERSHSSSAERQIPMNRGMSDVGVYYLT